MLFRTLFFLLALQPLLLYSQININLNDLELEDIEIPPITDLETLEGFGAQKTYPPDKTAAFEARGGINEKIPRSTYTQIPEEEILWKENIYPSKNESYYLYFSMGYGNITYNGSMSFLNPALDFNLFGVYWPKFNKKFLVGMIVDLAINEILIETTTTQIYQPALSLSLEYFFGQNIGSGLFVRTDFGFGSMAYLENKSNAYVLDYSLGASFLAGLGYGIPLSQETRLLINLNYQKKVQTFNNAPNGSDFGLISAGILF